MNLATAPLTRARRSDALRWEASRFARRALGAEPVLAGEPGVACEYCWAYGLIAADLYDDTGRACCLCCLANPHRKATMPTIKGVRL
jgi:hypothetical protein